MADVFISYAREDRAKAKSLAEFLVEQGLSVFWDRAIPVGELFAQRIESELKAASRVLVLWSADSVASNWVLDEADAARRVNKLIPVLIEAVNPPMGLRGIQTADLSGVSWDELAADPAVTALMQSLESLVGPPSRPISGRLDPDPDPDRDDTPFERNRHPIIIGIFAGSALVFVVLTLVVVVALLIANRQNPDTVNPPSSVSVASTVLSSTSPSDTVDPPSSVTVASTVLSSMSPSDTVDPSTSVSVASSLQPSTSSPGPSVEQSNLLQDGSFENGAGWRANYLESSVQFATRPDLDARDGEQVGLLTVSEAEGSIAHDVPFTVRAGDTFVFSTWVRSDGGNPIEGRIGIWVADDDGSSDQEPDPGSADLFTPFTATDQWQHVTYPLTLRRNHIGFIRAEIYVLTTGQTLLVDDAILTQY